VPLETSLFGDKCIDMHQSNKRKNANTGEHHFSKQQNATSGNHVMKVFMMYFVVFGSILAFIGLMGDDTLLGSGFYIWLLVGLDFVISTVATIAHTSGGQKSKIDEIAEKW
jgi:hypothetical protein